MAKNIRIHYLHRDSGNYKNFGYKDFSNPRNIPLKEVSEHLKLHLIDEIYFYPEKANIQKFEIHRHCDDYSWYEIENIEIVSGASCSETIDGFIHNLRAHNH